MLAHSLAEVRGGRGGSSGGGAGGKPAGRSAEAMQIVRESSSLRLEDDSASSGGGNTPHQPLAAGAPRAPAPESAAHGYPRRVAPGKLTASRRLALVTAASVGAHAPCVPRAAYRRGRAWDQLLATPCSAWPACSLHPLVARATSR